MKKFGKFMYIFFGGWAFLIEIYYAYILFDVMGIILGIFIFPALLLAMPFYALFAFGNLSPLILSGISLIGLYLSADKIE